MADEPEETPGQIPDPAEPGHEETGLDLARSIARGLAGRTGPVKRAGLRNTKAANAKNRRFDGKRSGAHPDDRDPQTLDASMGKFIGEQGWETELRVHGVFSRWDAIVGGEVGAHCHPESYADGRLVVRTDSTAWATQMKLLAANVLRRLNEELGEQTVEMIDVLGPQAPSWSRGKFRVKGRGPRDTYG